MPWSIKRYLNVRQAYGPSFDAEGRRVAFLTNITGVPQVWQVTPEAGVSVVPWADQVTFEEDRVNQVVYAPAEHDGRLLYTRDLGGNEKLQLFLLSADGAMAYHLSAGYEEAMHLFGSWSDDGGLITFAANRRDPSIFDLYVQDVGHQAPRSEELAGARARMVWQNDTPGYLFGAQLSPDGLHAAVARASSSFDHTLLEIDLAAGKARSLLDVERPVRYQNVQYGPDGALLYFITDLNAEFLYVARLDLALTASQMMGPSSVEAIVAPTWDCTTMVLSEDGTKLAYAVNVEGADEIHMVDLTTSETRAIPAFAEAPGTVTDGHLEFSPDGERLAFSFSTSTRTADIYLWNLTTDEVRPITRSSHGGLPVERFVAPELIRYPTFDENEEGEVREIPAWFYRPEQTAEGPVVVMVHGGPESQFRPYFHFLVQYLVHHGYAVLAPNVRGSTGYGKSYSHLDDVERRMDSVADLAKAVEWLQDNPHVDGDRAVVYGGSYGGFMVLAALTTYPDQWAAGVDIVGISNLATFLENTSDYRRGHREAEYGRLPEDREFLERIAPINHVEQIDVPLMVIHGANDPRVPLSEAEQLVDALQARDVPVTFLVFDDEGHGIVKLKNKLVAYPAIVDFLREHVGSGAENSVEA